LYLARQRIDGKLHFYIKESYRDGTLLRSRKLFYLGSDPSQYIIYPGGHAFYIDDTVTEALEECGVKNVGDELEDVFWPFVKADVRRMIEPFRHRHTKRASKTDEEGPVVPIHSFDKRRACFLKCGEVTGRVVSKFPRSLLKPLREKSRDEIEQHFIQEECWLSTSELKTYLYETLDLQRFFTESFSRRHPAWLDEEKVEKFFLREICRLHDDRQFWAGEQTEEEAGKRLHTYLKRYVIMFFDNTFYRENPLGAYAQDFMNRHRVHRDPPGRNAVTIQKACVIFGVKKETLKTMTKRGLTRYYRRLAKKLHPDKGGSQEKFVELTHAYKELLKRKN
jgi:hypothetical protein